MTGGYAIDAADYVLTTVAKYSQSGLVEYLPSLNHGRHGHACSSFISDSGETVGFILSKILKTLYDPGPAGHWRKTLPRRNMDQPGLH